MRKFPVVGAILLALVTLPATSFAIDDVDTKKLRNRVTVDGVLDHLRSLQNIAIAHDGNRAATTGGYDASVDYVANKLRAAGYKVTLDAFEFPEWTKNGPATLAEIAPTARSFAEDTDFIVSQFAGSGDVTAKIVPTTDIEAPPSGGAGTGTSGCEPGDFPAATQGNIALMQRGTCPFVDKYANAKAAGAAAALIFNDGGDGREEPLFITSPVGIGIPTAMVSNDVGESLAAEAAAGDVTVNFKVDATTTPNTEYNVIADSPRGNKNRTIVAGAHLDSVEEGPGINDNGSGTATLIEVAEQAARLGDPRNRLRFAFWGAEEAGLVGSTAYVAEQVENGGAAQIEANVNFDMVGSPNFARFVYDGDLSDSPPPPSGAPAGSAQIESLFTGYFSRSGLVTDPTAFDGRSDYGPFIANGIPAGGLFTGAEGIKTEREASVYGGFAGLAYDPCYHQACDTFFNLSNTALDQMSDATAHATWTLAKSKSPITTAASGKKLANSKKRGKGWRYDGRFRVR